MTQVALTPQGALPAPTGLGQVPLAGPGLPPQSAGYAPGSNWGTIMALVGQAQTLVMQLSAAMQGQLGANVLAGGPGAVPAMIPGGGAAQNCCSAPGTMPAPLPGGGPLGSMPGVMPDADQTAAPLGAPDGDPLAGLTQGADPLAALNSLGDADPASEEPPSEASEPSSSAPPADVADGDTSARDAIADAQEAARPQPIDSSGESSGAANDAPAVDLANAVVSNAQDAQSAAPEELADGDSPAADTAPDAAAEDAAPAQGGAGVHVTRKGESLASIVMSIAEPAGADPQSVYEEIVELNGDDPRYAELFGSDATPGAVMKALEPGLEIKVPASAGAASTQSASPAELADGDAAAPAADAEAAATGGPAPSPEEFLEYLAQNPELLKRFAEMLASVQAPAAAQPEAA